MKKIRILLIILIISLFSTNTVFATTGRFPPVRTNPGNSGGNTGGGTGGSSGGSGSKPSPSTGVSIGYLSGYSKTNYHTNPPTSVINRMNSEVSKFWRDYAQQVNLRRYIANVGTYDYIRGDRNNPNADHLWQNIKGTWRATIQEQSNKRLTYSAWKTKQFNWTVSGGRATFSKVTTGNGVNTITFHEAGTYKIRAQEILERDNFQETIARVTLTATHNGSTIQSFNSIGNKVKASTSTSNGKVTNWTVYIGPEDLDKPIPVIPEGGSNGKDGGKIGTIPGKGSGTTPTNPGSNKIDNGKVNIKVEMVE